MSRILFERIITNTVSGLALLTIIISFVAYIEFRNTPVYENYTVEVANSPIVGETLELVLEGDKKLDCAIIDLVGIAVGLNGGGKIILNQFVEPFTQDLPKGDNVVNSWAFRKPPEMTAGMYHIRLAGKWDCNYMVFDDTPKINFRNILVEVK